MRFSTSNPSTVLAWLRLVRAPNLFTALGDPLAGLFLAAAVKGVTPSLSLTIILSLIALMLYAFGMIFNDVCDVDEDAATRPERPLPSRQIPLPLAQTACVVLAVTGMAVALVPGRAVFVTAIMLSVLIASYNLTLKHHTLYGPVAMGLCRGFSFLLGAAVFGWPLSTILMAVLLIIYISAVTRIAEFEDQLHSHGRLALLPSISMVAVLLYATGLLATHTHPFLLVVGVFIFTIGLVLNITTYRQLTKKAALPSTSRRSVGKLIRDLLFIQAGILMMCPAELSTWLAVIILGVCLPANVWLKQNISSS